MRLRRQRPAPRFPPPFYDQDMPESPLHSSIGKGARLSGASAMSDHLDSRTAATEVAHMLRDRLAGGAADALVIFASYHHRAGLSPAADIIASAIGSSAALGATAESVICDGVEREGRAGLCALALCLPGAVAHSFHIAPGEQDIPLADRDAMRERIGWRDDTRAVLIAADPFTTPPDALDLIASCGAPRIPLAGGFASGASQAGQNSLVAGSRAFSAGVAGLTISGDVVVDFLVSQGCRPIGPSLLVTRSEEHIIYEVGGRNVLQVVHDIAEALDDHERELLSKGLFVGVVIDEYKERFGRGDFLIRNVIGIDRTRRAIVVNDTLRPGQTVQFHVRDARTADEDLHLLLDVQQLREPAAGALLFTCNGRGTRLFDEQHHDAAAIRARLGALPLAGFFAAGEIGPIGARSFVHGHTASVAFFQARSGIA
jgi:small ligand-binding sensory domain FIST